MHPDKAGFPAGLPWNIPTGSATGDAQMKKGQDTKWIVPPGLLGEVERFERHVEAAHGDPIMIVGPSGVGKSLFLHIYRKLYEEKHGENAAERIITLNCSHFGSDPTRFRSEIFGHVCSVQQIESTNRV